MELDWVSLEAFGVLSIPFILSIAIWFAYVTLVLGADIERQWNFVDAGASTGPVADPAHEISGISYIGSEDEGLGESQAF